MVNGSTPFERLRGLNTHAEDFRCMINFISLIFAKFCDTTSTNDVGTSYQLRNKVDRRADVGRDTRNRYPASNTSLTMYWMATSYHVQ